MRKHQIIGIGTRGFCIRKAQAMERKQPAFFWHRTLAVLVICLLAPAPAPSAGPNSPAIDQVWSALEGEPFLTFQRARERYLSDDPEDAARFVRKGAAFLWLETDHADPTHLKQIELAAARLARIAEQVEGGSLATSAPLEMEFARAHLAMAKHYGSLSKKYEGLGDVPNSLRAMGISAGHLLAANYWSPEGLEEDEVAGVRKARSALDSAGKGKGNAGKALAEAFRKLNRGMEKISKYIRFYEAEQP